MELAKTILSEKMPPDFAFVDFEVVREEWNSYKLEDEAVLKSKFVLINVIMEKDFKAKIEKTKAEKGVKVGLGISSSNVIGVEAPLELRGEQSTKPCTPEELRASVVKDDIDFEVVKETWNVYKLENGIVMKSRSAPVNVARTSKFDNRGLPIYLADFTADVKVSLPKK